SNSRWHNRWFRDSPLSPATFHRNSVLTGYAAILHVHSPSPYRVCGGIATSRKAIDSRDAQGSKICTAAEFGEAIFAAKPKQSIPGPAHRRSRYSPMVIAKLRSQVSGPSLFDDQPNRGDKH